MATDWMRERRTIPNPRADAQAAALAAIERKASAWGLFVRARSGPEGPRAQNGLFYRYVGGMKGREPHVGFNTLPAVAEWVEENSEFI